MPPPLWDFALGVYAQPGVAPALLRLQDECGADICLILFLLWRGAGCHAQADAAIASWRAQVVHPLRAVRRALPPGDLRDRVKADELESERLQLLTLERLAPDLPAQMTAAEAMAAYATYLGTQFPADALAAISSASA